MKYLVIGLIVLIAFLVWWLDRRDRGVSVDGSGDASHGQRHPHPPQDGGVGGTGFFSGGGGS